MVQSNSYGGAASTLANVLQILNYIENSKQSTNDEVMKALEHQNQTYLKKILEKLENDNTKIS